MKLKNAQAGTIHVPLRLSFSIHSTVGGRQRKERRKTGKKKEKNEERRQREGKERWRGDIPKGICNMLR